jgi:hypothetical protein
MGLKHSKEYRNWKHIMKEYMLLVAQDIVQHKKGANAFQ